MCIRDRIGFGDEGYERSSSDKMKPAGSLGGRKGLEVLIGSLPDGGQVFWSQDLVRLFGSSRNAIQSLSHVTVKGGRYLLSTGAMEENGRRWQYSLSLIHSSVAATGGFMLAASMAAYPLAKHRFPGKKVILQLVVFAILFRTEVTAVPQYILMVKTRLIDTYAALILPALATSFGVFLMTQFAEGLSLIHI